MPLFKKSFKDAWAQAGADMDQEFARVMDFPPVAEIATELMAAFGPDGPKRGKPLTLNDLREWWLDRYDFADRRQRVVCSTRLRRGGGGPIREALQVLEHAELVYLTVRTDREDVWTATNVGLSALADGRDAVAERVGRRVAGSAAAEPKSAADRLQELETLRSAGVITDAEYAAKREHIIDGI